METETGQQTVEASNEGSWRTLVGLGIIVFVVWSFLTLGSDSRILAASQLEDTMQITHATTSGIGHRILNVTALLECGEFDAPAKARLRQFGFYQVHCTSPEDRNSETLSFLGHVWF